jgi:twitching motility protein PilT
MNSPMFEPTTSVLDSYPTRASLRRAQFAATAEPAPAGSSSPAPAPSASALADSSSSSKATADEATAPEPVDTEPIETLSIEPVATAPVAAKPVPIEAQATDSAPAVRVTAAYPAPGTPLPNKPLPGNVSRRADRAAAVDESAIDDNLSVFDVQDDAEAGVAGFSFFFPQAAQAVTRPIPRPMSHPTNPPAQLADSFARATERAPRTDPRAVTLEIGRREDGAAAASSTPKKSEPGTAGGDDSAHSLPDTADADLLLALAQVVLVGGSDLHITANAGPTLRVDGRLQPVINSEVWSHNKVTAALHSILTPEQEAKFTTELELDLAITLTSQARFRVNLYQQRGAIGGAFRLIPTEIKQLGNLGMPDVIGRFAALPRGLVLVTGPTGSGKSTTLAALLDLVNRTRADHIVTVEDPIEFLHGNKRSLVNQREVGSDTHSFAAALKHVLRQDPDVILIGELRDLETISVALTAAETGHLVFATLHTQDAAQSIDRVIDVFPPHQQAQVRAQLASTLQGVVCQTLIRRASGTGRVAATEVLVTTPAIANLIRDGKTHQIHSAMQAGRDLGMHTLDQRLAELVDKGQITHAAALERARDAAGLRQLIQRDLPVGSGAPLSVGGVDYGDSYSAVEPTR